MSFLQAISMSRLGCQESRFNYTPRTKPLSLAPINMINPADHIQSTRSTKNKTNAQNKTRCLSVPIVGKYSETPILRPPNLRFSRILRFFHQVPVFPYTVMLILPGL